MNETAPQISATEAEAELLGLAHAINSLSAQLDEKIIAYREAAKAYNRNRSFQANEQILPAQMNVSGLPCVTTQAGKDFNLKLGMRKVSEAIAFEQQPQPYVAQNFSPSMSQSLETRIAALKNSLNDFKNHRESIANWDADRIAMVEQQIAETQRQIKILEQQQEGA